MNKNSFLKTKIFELIKVEKKKAHVSALFQILKKRKKFDNISHKTLPTYKQHKMFVDSFPYRYWFLVVVSEEYIGTVFVSKNNEISIKLLKHNNIIYKEILNLIITNIKPLKGIPSKRNSNFIINVSNRNIKVKEVLKKIKAEKIQETYEILL